MNKTTINKERLPWSTPELRRIDAGSAEAKTGNGTPDGGTGGNDKS